MMPLLCICYLTCFVAEYSMINHFVAQCVKTCRLIPACLLVLVTGFSALVVQNCYAGRILPLPGRFEHYARLSFRISLVIL